MGECRRLFAALFLGLLLHVCQPSQTGEAGQQGRSGGNTDHTAFGVARTSSLTTLGTIPFPVNLSNVDGFFRGARNNFLVRRTGLYFVHFCAGVDAGNSTEVKKLGGFPNMAYRWESTSHRDVRTGCRSGLMPLTPGVGVRLAYTAGSGVYSSSLMESAFSGFSLTDFMNSSSTSASLFVTYSLFPDNRPFRIANIHVNPISQNFDTADDQYTCAIRGYYIVSFSADIDPEQRLQLQLQDANDALLFELTRNTTATNGNTTLSRSVLFECNLTFHLKIAYGQLSDNPRPDLVSLTVVPYFPIGQSAAWAFYLTSNLTAGAQPKTVVFDDVGISTNVVNVANSSVIINYSGSYMVYLSAATFPGQPLNLLLTRNGNVLMGLASTATEIDGADMMDHGAIVELDAGDVLLVSMQARSSVASDVGKQVAFWGCLIDES